MLTWWGDAPASVRRQGETHPARRGLRGLASDEGFIQARRRLPESRRLAESRPGWCRRLVQCRQRYH